jgi:hypothetical protein
LPSSTDEGFEDSRSGDFTRSPPLSQVPLIDFRKPKENQREEVIYTSIRMYHNVKYIIIYLNRYIAFAELTKTSKQRRRIVGNDKAGLYGMVIIRMQSYTLR